jgi:hypothetical protein
MGLQSHISPNFGNVIWVLVMWPRIKYKGEGGGFPQFWAMVSVVSLCLPVARPRTKSAPAMH